MTGQAEPGQTDFCLQGYSWIHYPTSKEVLQILRYRNIKIFERYLPLVILCLYYVLLMAPGLYINSSHWFNKDYGVSLNKHCPKCYRYTNK